MTLAAGLQEQLMTLTVLRMVQGKKRTVIELLGYWELRVHDMAASDVGSKSTRQSYVELRGKLDTSLSL
jgi:hypothetical protein